MSRVFRSGNYITHRYKGRAHRGIDLTPSSGSWDILAHSAGKVVIATNGYGNMWGSEGNLSYGNFVKIKHSNGAHTLYAHMSYTAVSVGQSVGHGQNIGVMGNSCNRDGSHLHFEYHPPGSGY